MYGVRVMIDEDIQSFDIGSLDPADSVPLYQQLRDRLRLNLIEGWPRDRPIPSERQIMQMTGLSRMTVRQAIAELVHEGMLRRDHGRGTFVADSRITRLLTGHSSFRDVVQRQGSTPVTIVVRQQVVSANAAQATLLQIEPDEALLDLVRIRTIDSDPVMVDYTHVPLRLCPNLPETDLSGSLYEYLANVCGTPAQHSIDTIEAVAAVGEVAELLEVLEGAPLLLLRRLARTIDDIPLEITDEYVRPDRCLYRFENPAGFTGIDLVDRDNAPSEEADS
jgi:GntR family transcriptional regulator